MADDEKEAARLREVKDQIERDWLQHPITLNVVDGFKSEAEQAREGLLAAARKSSDAECRMWAMRYLTLVQCEKTCRGEKVE